MNSDADSGSVKPPRREPDPLPLRALAARLLADLLTGKGSLADALPIADRALPDRRDRAQLRQILYATLRHLYSRKAALGLLMARPLPASARQIEALLLLGLTQLDLGIDAGYAVVAASVDAARALGYPRLASLVNAVLRRAEREGRALYQRLPDEPSLRFEHPAWLIERLRQDWPDHWTDLLDANNQAPPLWLRVNRRRTDRDQVLAAFATAGIAASAHPWLPDALRVEAAGVVTELPGWEAGLISVQDAAAQFAVEALDLRPGLRVLDACAAPGGKLAQAAEREPALAELLGLDRDGRRVEQTRVALHRLGLAPRLKQADAADPTSWWQGEAFDRILIDAPCSGTGVIRRHPEIRLLRRASDLAGLIAEQARLLGNLWPLLAPGGKLVYATCSVLRDENQNPLAAFLARHPEAVALPLPEQFGVAAGVGRQNLVGQDDADGFFYALLGHRA
ncbi:MAG: 16S rRNA (cytosine(967)-C(5))-methyltransferase RsmB [Lysobacterales bacterium]